MGDFLWALVSVVLILMALGILCMKPKDDDLYIKVSKRSLEGLQKLGDFTSPMEAMMWALAVHATLLEHERLGYKCYVTNEFAPPRPVLLAPPPILLSKEPL